MLVSTLLSGNERLGKCATLNPSHVTEGENGPHVKLIQLALMITDNADIARAELEASSYGPSTKAAVLAFKTQRSIINFSYQSKPDPIVGIMTIRALDAEVAAREFKNNLGGQAGRPGVDVGSRRS
jgi:peptidoglycan hydrolase-like protein with peptidoglycan-binding domain